MINCTVAGRFVWPETYGAEIATGVTMVNNPYDQLMTYAFLIAESGEMDLGFVLYIHMRLFGF